uniref:A2M domain-containing protein n=1 Tax=Caenorhabditis tropicalis TaxID=1561998 RepID=A0A1I7T5S1_9PELO
MFVEARENGTGYRQDLVLSLDVMAPKFTITAVRPYFTADTEDIILLIDGDGITQGNVSIRLEPISEKNDIMLTKEVKVSSKIGEALKIGIPKEWRNVVSVIRVIAQRQIKNGYSNETMLYIPNLSNTTLMSSFITSEEVRSFYRDDEIMNVIVADTGKEMNFVIICNSHTIHRVPNDVKNNILRVKITDRMEGTCILTAFTLDSRSDVMLFRVETICQDCNVKVSKVSNGMSKELRRSDAIEPGDVMELQFTGHSEAIVFYRAMDERLNYITLRNDYMVKEYQDYLIFGKQSFGAKILNLVNEERMEKTMKEVCTAAGHHLRFRCEQGQHSTSLVSEKCLKHVLKSCYKNSTATVLPIMNPYMDRKQPMIMTASSTNWLEKVNIFRSKSINAPHALFVKPEFHDTGVVAPKPKIRQYFPETWLFDAIVLERNGTKKVISTSPDNVGQWSLNSAYWWHGKVSLFPGDTKYIQSRKPIFLEVDMPKNVYVNETISPLLTVTGVDLPKSRQTFVICLSELPRKVCADQGANGNKGDTYYMKVEASRSSPIQSKYLMMKFLSPGLVNMTVTLRTENCETGKILDAVRKQIEIQKRADTEEYYERHILNPNKPLVTAMNDDPDSTDNKDTKMISFSDQHGSNDDADTINTLISSNVPDTETVHSFSITLSKFLPLYDRVVPISMGSRFKRNGQRILTSVIKELAVVLYKFKKVKLSGFTSYQMEANINDLINEMMQFSNCTSRKEPCAYSEFGKPQSSKDVSILLTSIATSLLCEADVEENRVLGSLKTITAYIPKLGKRDFNEDLSDIIDVESTEDKKYLLVSFMYQVSRDCASYRSSLKDMSKSFGKLHKYFYELDESKVSDGRTSAAIAFMATNATAELMRSDLISKINKEHPPYWKCSGYAPERVDKLKRNNESFKRRRESCQVMVNSFALSAIVSAYAEGTEIDWDRLADWISEQQSSDGSYGSPLTTLVATRSLYEKRRRTVEIAFNDHLEVIVRCKGCTEKRVNVTESPIEIHIPNNIHYVTLITKGRGKAVVAARILATKRPRPKRGLTQDDYYPVHLSIDQKVQDNFVHQTVCFNVTNPTIKTLDIFHGTFTLFTATPDQLYFLNETYTPINPSSSALGLHFIITNIVTNQTICYKVALSESKGGKNVPYKSAPVPIRATHPVQGLVGMILIAHPDVPKSDVVVRHRRHHHTRTRFVRRIIDESAVDTVCYDGGECSCAETTCSVKCNKCEMDSPENLKELLSTPGFFGIRFELNSISSSIMNGANYTIFDGTVKDSNGLGSEAFELSKKVRVWLRACNIGCGPQEVLSKPEKKLYYVLGHEDGLNSDSYGRQNYILNHLDRFEESSYACHNLNTAITIRF